MDKLAICTGISPTKELFERSNNSTVLVAQYLMVFHQRDHCLKSWEYGLLWSPSTPLVLVLRNDLMRNQWLWRLLEF
jgi:hypothetical protein